MSDESLTRLIMRLSHSEFSERRKAEDALVERGEAAVALLITVVEQQGIIAALRAASALSRIGDKRGILPVARLLLRDNAPFQVFELLASWPNVPSEWAVNDLLKQARFIATSEDAPRYGFLQRLRALSPNWTPPLTTATPVSMVATPDDIPGLIQTLRSSNHTLREAATAKLIGLGRDAVPTLLEALSHDSPLVRYRAVEALGHIGDTRAVEPLLALRKTLDMDILESVTKALIVLARHLAAAPCSQEIPQLIALVRHLRFDAALQPAALSAALALETLAHTEPTPQLRGALKWLKSLWAPLPIEFKAARKAIEDATEQWKDLPLVSGAPMPTINNLPVPAAEEDA